MLQQPYRKRPVADVVRDIQAIRTLHKRPFIEFADDNTFVDHHWSKELCRALIPLGIKWFAETDISVADENPHGAGIYSTSCPMKLPKKQSCPHVVGASSHLR